MKTITLNEHELHILMTILVSKKIDIIHEIQNGDKTDIMKSYLNDTEELINKLENARDMMITTRERMEEEIEILKQRWDDVYEKMCDLKRQGREEEARIKAESLTRIKPQINILEWILKEEDEERELQKTT